MNVKCPYCEQDWVWQVEIPNAKDAYAMCMECDTIWTKEEEIRYSTGVAFQKFMNDRNQQPNWNDIKLIAKVNADETE
jgi:hypothetical protein